jgi:alpha-L-fucosidase
MPRSSQSTSSKLKSPTIALAALTFGLSCLLTAAAQPMMAGEIVPLGNPGFETGSIAPWKKSGAVEVDKDKPRNGQWVLHFGGGPGTAEQTVPVKSNSVYCFRGWLRSSSGALTVALGAKNYGGLLRTVSTARGDWTEVELPFTTGLSSTQATLFAQAHYEAWGDDFSLEYLGPAPQGRNSQSTNTIEQLEPRIPATGLGVTQLSNERMDWLLDQRFGLFIHWGLYAGPGRNEWVMNNEAIPPEKYKKFASPESGEEYFAADRFDAKAWAQLAKDAGMRWVCLTARHHEGYSLFDVPHPNSFTSMQTHKRDFIAEYVAALRQAGLGVGLYYSPLSWRYPGYFDPTGKDCKPNNWKYQTDPAHHENSRLMKEENYVAVKQLMTKYGHIDHIYWDGAWLSHQGTDADAAYFHEPGLYLDPKNPWPISREYQDIDPATGKAWGIMGMVRHYQPDAITNPRYGWMGDIGEEEGGDPVIGPIRTAQLCDKNLTIHPSGWGYPKEAIRNGECMTRDEIIRLLADCTVRNMTMLLNVGPDRHGEIAPLAQVRLREVGAWLAKTGEAIYGTRGGPWHPEDGRYGYSRKGDTIYVHLLKEQPGDQFSLPPVGPLRPVKCWEVVTGRALSFSKAANCSITIKGIDRTQSPADTIIGVRFDKHVMTYALPCK